MATVVEKKPGLIARSQLFISEVNEEMAKVTWPSFEDLKVMTKVTMMMLVLMAVIIYVFDFFFKTLVGFLLNVAT